MIPIGERAILWVEKYVEAVRPSLVGNTVLEELKAEIEDDDS